jgi:PAS domain S-box-containing protein
MGSTPPSETLQETLAVFEAFEPLTTPEVADRLDIGRRTAYARLDRLADSDWLETKKVGANARVWWVPPDGDAETAVDGVDATDSEMVSTTPSRGERPDQHEDGRTARERELERYETIVETVDDGIYVVDEGGYFTGVNGTYESMVGRDREALLGTHVSTVIDDEETLAEAKRLEAELATGERSTATLEADIPGPDGELRVGEATFALMETDEGHERIGVVRDVTERRERERELERQREQLAALNSIDEVVRETTRAVIEESTRAEIESTVCDRLAASDSYAFAWVGDVDTTTGTVDVRTEAGVENYLADVTVPVDPDEEVVDCPAASALRTGTVETVRHDDDGVGDRWRFRVTSHGCRSAVAIPVTHEGTVYCVLTLYTDRTDAFTGQERSVLAGLGEVVGHAIAATERKQALMGDDIVELEFQVRDVFAGRDLPVEQRGRLELDHAVPIGGGSFLVYGTASAEAVETLPALVETVPFYESVSFAGDLSLDDDATLDDDTYSFAIRMSDPPILSVVASLGGSVDSAVIEDGEFELTVHLTPSVDVREVTDAVEAAYPGAEMLRRRQLSRTGDERQRIRRRLAAELTERQQTALEVAYHAGFYDWPRSASGEDLADSLDVAPPTVHQHLRKAERKVLDELFATDGPAAGQ